MRGLPNALSALRLALAPVLLALAWSGAPRAFVGCLALSLATDVVDGKIARRTGQASERGAVLDSWADLATYASLPPSAWWLRPGFVRAEASFLLVAVASYVVPVVIGFLKYGRLTSYHTRGAKLAAYLGGASALVVFAGGPALPFRLATAVLVLAELEEIAITAVLPAWHANMPSLACALALRGCGSTEIPAAELPSTTAAEGSTRKCTSVVVLLGAWFIMIPPETVNWHCARVQHDEAPMEQWKPFFRFETQEACESLRSELVRRESNPRRREAATAHMAEMDRRYRHNTPLHVRVFDYLFCGKCYLWVCGKDPGSPLDPFGHARCAYREQGTP